MPFLASSEVCSPKKFGHENEKQYLCAPIIIKVIARYGDVLWNLAVPQGVAWAIN